MLQRSLLLLGVLATSVSAQTLHLCRDDRTEEGRATMLWAQIRQALASADSADMAGREPLAIGRFDRTVDRNGEVKFETAVDGRRYGTRLLRGASPEELSREGFVVVDSAGHAEFRAPDAHVFLSQQFASDHCFETVPGGGTGFFTGMAGLRFRPVTGRKVSDIAGVFWADADSGALHLVEFSYVTYGTTQKDLQGAGGRLTFERLPSANWIIRDWVVRTPVTTQRGQLLGYREQGGETMLVSRSMFAIADSIRNARKAPGRLIGVIMDSLVDRVFVGARVWLDSAGPEAHSDSRGAFSLGHVSPGVHVVSFAHPTLDSLGLRALRMAVRVESDSTTSIVLAGPTLRTLKGGLCADSTALVTGVVRDAATGAPIDSAQVTVAWLEPVFVDGRLKSTDLLRLAVYSNARGRYAACVPQNPQFTISARAGVARTGAVDLRADERGLGIANFSIDRLSANPRFGTATLEGIVKYQDGTPLSRATVRLSDPEMSTITDEAGRFRLSLVPGGTRVLDTRAPGHAPMRTIVDVRPRDTTRTTVYLRRVQAVDPEIVRAAAGDESPRTIAELDERRRSGPGNRLTQSDLSRFKDARVDAVVRSLPFTRVRGTRITIRNRLGRECEPTIWLDGRRTAFEVIEVLQVRDIVALEAFAQKSEVPLDYQNASDCGAILVWTRDAIR